MNTKTIIFLGIAFILGVLIGTFFIAPWLPGGSGQSISKLQHRPGPPGHDTVQIELNVPANDSASVTSALYGTNYKAVSIFCNSTGLYVNPSYPVPPPLTKYSAPGSYHSCSDPSRYNWTLPPGHYTIYPLYQPSVPCPPFGTGLPPPTDTYQQDPTTMGNGTQTVSGHTNPCKTDLYDFYTAGPSHDDTQITIMLVEP